MGSLEERLLNDKIYNFVHDHLSTMKPTILKIGNLRFEINNRMPYGGMGISTEIFVTDDVDELLVYERSTITSHKSGYWTHKGLWMQAIEDIIDKYFEEKNAKKKEEERVKMERDQMLKDKLERLFE